MKRRSHSEEESALVFAGDAVFLLRRLPALAWLAYLAGTVPFLVGGLFFWSEMSSGPDAAAHLPTWSFALVALFVWHKFCQVDFCRRLRGELTGQDPPQWTMATVVRVLKIQVAVQPWGLLLIPIAALLVGPLPWVLGFFQGVTVLAGDEPGTAATGGVVSRAWRQAAGAVSRHFVLLFVLKLAALLLFLNLVLAAGLAPFLAKKLLDLDSAFSMGISAYLNTTFAAAVLATTAMAFDPFLKAVYTLRSFRGEAVSSGEDLRSELRFLRRGRELTVVLLAGAMCFLGSFEPAAAAGPVPPAKERPASSGTVVPTADFDRAIDRTLNGREYRWRSQRNGTAKPESNQPDDGVGWLDRFRRWMGTVVDDVASGIGRLLQRLFGGLGRLGGGNRSVSWSLFSLGTLVYVVLAVAVVAVAWVVTRWWLARRREPGSVVVAQPVTAVPDLARDDVSADELPVDEWLRLGAELRGRGEFRLAMRAYFLSGLADLGRRGLVQPARFKSNRDYARELQRRAHALPAVPGMFAGLVAVLERCWYGCHVVDAAGLDAFAGEVERLKSC